MRGEQSASPSEQIIPPEIINDDFYDALRWLAACEPLQHILEIGSSAGEGSTKALVEGISLNKMNPTLYCLEVSRPRFLLLAKAYLDVAFVRPFNMSSVGAEEYPLESEIASFYNSRVTGLNQFPLEMVLSWRKEGLRYLHESGVEQHGIEQVKREAGIEHFDMVLIDGAEFTGKAELRLTHGANIICLDDATTFKCFENRETLLNDPQYELAYENLNVRNGFSIFIRRNWASRWLHVKHATEKLLNVGGATASQPGAGRLRTWLRHWVKLD